MADIKKEVPRTIVIGKTCDVCGKNCSKPYGQWEAATLEAHWGYFSSKDGESYNCDLCEGCFDRVVEFIESVRKV